MRPTLAEVEDYRTTNLLRGEDKVFLHRLEEKGR